jgi:hypothetical protein
MVAQPRYYDGIWRVCGKPRRPPVRIVRVPAERLNAIQERHPYASTLGSQAVRYREVCGCSSDLQPSSQSAKLDPTPRVQTLATYMEVSSELQSFQTKILYTFHVALVSHVFRSLQSAVHHSQRFWSGGADTSMGYVTSPKLACEVTYQGLKRASRRLSFVQYTYFLWMERIEFV